MVASWYGSSRCATRPGLRPYHSESIVLILGALQVQQKYITGLIDVIKGNMDGVDESQRDSLDKYLRNTLKFITAEGADAETTLTHENPVPDS